MTRTILPAAAMEKLLKKCGASRVSEEAKVALRDLLEEHADKVGKKAVELANHSGRKTVKASDIKLAGK
ncbi:MAG: NFYB/HAP3 family transcription factor subunit [Candidatus Nanoarchaeia archaeon]|nr:NFYB/HAP3 family transcription factor subunit [Candidatus Nanoarchaeia archaeon]